MTALRQTLKRAIDLLGAAAGLIALAPVLLLTALAVWLRLGAPVLFRQVRAGRGGEPFEMLKFRTMTDARDAAGELLPDAERLTGFGRWLRSSSLDELPELINVLRGEMSLVGPRPLPVDEVARFDDMSHRRRLSVKPGLTCLWQVSGRNNVKDFRDWVRLDLEYIDNWSLWLDLKILARTIPVVLLGAGAK
jgi:lipopolysaccharide/colanic/teichoic acid biosynthesis glycosyltransferase